MNAMRSFAAEILSYIPSEAFLISAASAEVFVVADDMQFSTNAGTNRTRIKTATGAAGLTIPVLTKGRGAQKLDEVEIDLTRSWQRQHWRALKLNYHNAPYWDELADELEALYQKPYHKLMEVNWEFCKFIWQTLRWENLPRRTSELGLVRKGEARLLEIAQKTNAEIYLAHEKYRPALHAERLPNLQLQFCDWPLPSYHQQFDGFVSGLNILDLLFNEGARFTRERLQNLAPSLK